MLCSASFRIACAVISVPSLQATTSAIQYFIMTASSAPLSSLPYAATGLPAYSNPSQLKTRMHGNPVERLDAREFGKLVDQARRKKDFRSTASRAIRTDKIESFSGTADDRDPR